MNMTIENDEPGEENEIFSDEFVNDIDFENEFPEENATDKNVIEADFTETRTRRPPRQPSRGVIQGEIERDEFAEMLETLPADQIVTINVWRCADKNLAGQFRVPCESYGHKDSIYWKHPTTAAEIYSDIQAKHGGGLYQFQLRKQRGFAGKMYSQIILDGAELSKAEKLLNDHANRSHENERHDAPQAQAQPQPTPGKRSQIKEWIAELKELKELQNLLTPEQAPAQPVQNPGMDITDQIKLKVVETMLNQPDKSDKLTDLAFGIFQPKEETSKSIWDLGFYALTHMKETTELIGGVAQTVIPLIMPAKQPPPSNHIVATAPATAPTEQAKASLQQFAANPQQPPTEPPTAPAVEPQPPAQQPPASLPTFRKRVSFAK